MTNKYTNLWDSEAPPRPDARPSEADDSPLIDLADDPGPGFKVVDHRGANRPASTRAPAPPPPGMGGPVGAAVRPYLRRSGRSMREKIAARAAERIAEAEAAQAVTDAADEKAAEARRRGRDRAVEAEAGATADVERAIVRFNATGRAFDAAVEAWRSARAQATAAPDASLEDAAGVEAWVREMTDRLAAVHRTADAVVDADTRLASAEAQEQRASYLADHRDAGPDDLALTQINARIMRPTGHADGKLLLRVDGLLQKCGDVPLTLSPPLVDLVGPKVVAAVNRQRAGLGMPALSA